ncbi:MAG: hypothetical protein ACR2LI_13355 [Propionibacteriaceae bacterium]
MATANRFASAAAIRSGPTPTPGSVGEETRKYTLLLTTTAANQLDEDLLNVRRTVGKKIDKSEVIRALIGLLHDDPALVDKVVDRLSDR